MKLLITTQVLDKNHPILGFFHAWVEKFAEHCESVIVICLYEGKHNLPQNVKVLSLGKEVGVSRLKYLIRFYSYIIRERKNYDAVFVHMNQIYVILGGLLWRLWHKHIGLWYVHKEVTPTLRLAEKITQDIFTSTENSFRIESAKKHMVGHGIDTDIFKPSGKKNSEKLTILSIGRISPVKDYETLIKAVETLTKNGVEVQVTIVGGAGTREQEPYLESLQREVEDRGLSDIITFSGPITHEQVPVILQKSDVFAHMSKTGSLDKAALEAMAMGIPVVSCNESVEEVIPPGLRDVLMFLAGDAQQLAGKIQSLSELPSEQRDEIGHTLRAVVIEKYNLTKLIKTLVGKLQQI